MKAEEVNKRFAEKGLTLGSVESFTGGLFAKTITSVPGASKLYKGGLVTYATEEKIKLLGIKEDVVKDYGVVSKNVAFCMARNGLGKLNVDVCVSFTGNAGPDVMEEKPVGEVYIGIADKEYVRIYSLYFSGNREEIQQQAVEFALKKLLENY